MSDGRALVWFSCGAASAVALKLAVMDPPRGLPVEAVYCDPGREDADNPRFMADVSRWAGVPVTVLKNPKYKDHIDVARKERYVNGPYGAKCTRVLKKAPREKYQRAADVHVWGFDLTEQDRADQFAEDHPELASHFPLIEAGLTKDDCFHLIRRAGIDLPAAYAKGFKNNNCIGCWKGGAGYWNRVRAAYPETFAEAAAVCREIGRSPIKDRDGNPVMLDDLDPAAGRYDREPDPTCGIMCQLAEFAIERAEGRCGM